MSEAPSSPLFTPGLRRWLWGLGVLLALALLVGFVWLPSAQPDYRAQGWWASLCRAAGLPAAWYAPAELEDRQATRVVLSTANLAQAVGDVGPGGTLALRCTMCHGARGVSASDVPNLAGQYPGVIYKQMLDYRAGHRRHALMQALAATLSDRDVRDLAAFYAQLPRPSPNPVYLAPPALVAVGAPLRGIAPCASCHGGIDLKLGSAWLEGMPRAYLVEQMQAFARGERRNDAHASMRNVARQMTPQEIEETATWYSSRREPFSASVVR